MSKDAEYTRIGNFILVKSHKISEGNYDYDDKRLKYVFNFESRQVSTIYENNPDGSQSGIGVTMTTQNFSEIEGKEMIAAAHAKLIQLGGNPGELKLDAGKSVRKPGGKALKID